MSKKKINGLFHILFFILRVWDLVCISQGLPWWLSGKESACNAGAIRRCKMDPWVRKMPWRRARQPAPVFLPGNPMDRGAWQATVHSVAKSRTQLKRLGMHVAHVFYDYSTFRLELATFQLINSQSSKWLDLSDLHPLLIFPFLCECPALSPSVLYFSSITIWNGHW